MTTTPITAVVRRGRGLDPHKAQVQQNSGGEGSTLPEYLDAQQIQTILAAALNPRARLLMLFQ